MEYRKLYDLSNSAITYWAGIGQWATTNNVSTVRQWHWHDDSNPTIVLVVRLCGHSLMLYIWFSSTDLRNCNRFMELLDYNVSVADGYAHRQTGLLHDVCIHNLQLSWYRRRFSHSRCSFALSQPFNCLRVVSRTSSVRRNSLCDVTQRRAAAMYSATQDACCRSVAGLPASVSNWSHQIACRRCYCVRRAGANNPQYYDSVDSRPASSLAAPQLSPAAAAAAVRTVLGEP